MFRCLVLTLTLVGLASWNLLPLDPSGRVRAASTHTRRAASPVQATQGAVVNGRIAFVSREGGSGTNADIYTMNANGSDRLRLTFDPGEDGEPAWSPDGTKIAFVRKTVTSSFADTREIYVMNADGSDQRRLTQPGNNIYHYSPTWSPDGTMIAFSKVPSNSNGVIVMNANGSDQRTIFGDGFSNPAWSPEGSKLAGNRDSQGLVLINIDGSNLSHITQPPQPFNPATYFWDFGPSWSPDGSKIIFNRYVDCDINDCYTPRLYVVNSDGSNPTDLTPQGHLGISPAWSPDGRKIVFGDGDIYVMNPDGSGLTNLTTTNDKLAHSPSWQPLRLPAGVNLIDDPEFFVRQHYRDFLAREPEQSGLDAWLLVLRNCAGGDAECVHEARLATSAAFFGSPEFRLKGYFVFRFYKTAFNRLPAYEEIAPDMRSVAGQTPGDVYTKKAVFTNSFVQRSEFQQTYSQLSNSDFVAQLLGRYQLNSITTPDPASPDGEVKVTLTNNDLIAQLNAGMLTHAKVLRAIADSDQVSEVEFNRAFVAMQYYGYLGRTPEPAGFNAWLTYLTAHPQDFREMVRGFVDSVEYRRQFGQP